MYYIGLDVHKKTISYCVKDASGKVHHSLQLYFRVCPATSFYAITRDGQKIYMTTYGPGRHQTTSSSALNDRQAVLDCASKSLVRMERVARPRHSENGCGLASSRLPPVLDMAVTSQAGGR